MGVSDRHREMVAGNLRGTDGSLRQFERAGIDTIQDRYEIMAGGGVSGAGGRKQSCTEQLFRSPFFSPFRSHSTYDLFCVMLQMANVIFHHEPQRLLLEVAHLGHL
jgi:hypothetical protein